MSMAELNQQIAADRAAGIQRVSAFLLRGMLASKAWAAMTQPRYYPALNWDKTYIWGAAVCTSPNPFRCEG